MKRKFPSGGFIFACVINYLEFTFIWGLFSDFRIGFIAALPTLIVVYAIVLTPWSDFYYRHKLGLRTPNEKELKRIKLAWGLVLKGTADNNIRIPENLKIYVKDDNEANAFAVGTSTIAIHTGMLMGRIRDDEIAGVLGHELGHIVNGDTVSLLMSIQGSNVLDLIFWFCKFLVWLMEKAITIMFTILGTVWSEGNLNAGVLLGKIVGYTGVITGKIIDFFAWIIVRIETAGYMLFSRQDELAADRFSVLLGLGKGLKDCLIKISGRERVNKFSIEYILQGTHPPTSERVEKIEIMMRQMQDAEKKEIIEETANTEKDEPSTHINEVVEIVDLDKERYSDEQQFKIALKCIQNGETKQGFSMLKILADKEYPKAYTELGRCYLYGIGVEGSKNNAVHYLKKALEYKDAEGIYLLAECYASAGSQDKYMAAAFKCYYNSALLGHTAAIVKVGLCCLDGKGTKKNEKAAYNWLRTAVEKRNYQKAAYSLAKCYIEGIGTPKDIRKGVAVLKRGIECGCDDIDKAKDLMKNCMFGKLEKENEIQDVLRMSDD